MKQPFLRFYLNGRPNKHGEKKIMLDINMGYSVVDPTKLVKQFNSDRKIYKPVYISTRCRIKPEHFGKYIQKGSRKVHVFDEKIFLQYSKTHRSVKTRLDKMTHAVNEVVNQFYIQEIEYPTPEAFKKSLEMKLGRTPKEVVREKGILEFLYDKIKDDREAIVMKKKDAPTENYIKTYVSLSRMFENYQITKNTLVVFSDFNSKGFYWDFFKVVDAIYRGEIQVDNPNQLKKQRKDPTGYGAKSINKYVKLLHRILSLGRKEGENVTLDLSDNSLFLENPPAEKEIYLTEADLQKAITNTVSDPELKNTRQYIIMASLMGLRVEDMEHLHRLSPELFKGKRGSFYGVKTTIRKTKSEVIIPLLKPVRELLEANGNTFPVFKEHDVNTGLKRFCKLSEIDSLEKRTKISFTQGKIVTADIPKHELVSTHDCRRSFITNLLKNNVNGERIKYITHSQKQDSKDMIALYNKASLIDKAELFLSELELSDSEIYAY